MAIKLICSILDTRGLPVEGLPVYLTSNSLSYSGLTSPEGKICFVIPKFLKVYVYIYNPIVKDFVGKFIYLTSDGEHHVTLLYDLKANKGRDEELGTCEICGNPMYLGERIYIYNDKVLHYDCFQNMRKKTYISELRELLTKIESTNFKYTSSDDICEFLGELGFHVREDIPVNYHMHPVEVYEAINNKYAGSDFILDILAIYPGKYPDMNLILAISLYNSYRKSLLELSTFTPYKLIIREWGEAEGPGIYKPHELPQLLKDIVKTELQMRGICG